SIATLASGNFPASTRFSAESSTLAGNNACTVTVGHSGVSCGGGSSCGSLPASTSETAAAPASVSSASTAGASSLRTESRSVCQLTLGPSLQAEALLEIVDVGAAGLERGVLKDLVVQRHVGADAVDHDFVQRGGHAGDRRA